MSTKETIRAEVERRRKAQLDENGNAKNLFCAVRLWAYDDLLGILDTLPEQPASEDERIRKEILNFILYKAGKDISEEQEHRWIAWLEKQKEQKPLTVEDVVEQSKRFGREVEVLHKDEQKPVEYLNKDKVYAIMKKLHDLAFSQRIPINSDEYKKIGEITSDVRSLLDYPIEQKVQKPAEWSEEDEEMLDIVLTMVDCSTVVPHSGGQLHPSESYKKDISEWLKSLRPSWKPSKELVDEMAKMWLEWRDDDISYLTYVAIARHFAEWGSEHAKK